MSDLSHVNAALIVEDDFFIATDLERALLSHGCGRAEMVGSCSEALDLVETTAFDLVTVDVKLSDTDCDRLVEVLRNRSIPFIYVSGYLPASHPDLPEAPWLSKPADDADLLSALLSVRPSTTGGIQPSADRAKVGSPTAS
jgi:ActR/RegA family two-component response regulator